MRIQFGTLLNVFGKPASCEGITFVPADVELDGYGFSRDFPLGDFTGEHPPVILSRSLVDGYDAAWVRGRLPIAFGFTPEVAEVEKSLLDVAFVAVAAGSDVGYPFVCTDHYGRAGLTFSPDGPDSETQAKLAAAFWRLLLQSPDDVADFAASVYHPGAGIWLQYSCESGELFFRESDSEDG